MTDPEILNLNVRQEITVNLPGSNYIVTYPPPTDLSVLVNNGFAWEQDTRTAMTPSEFLDRAYDVASMRARELGWL